MCTQKKLLNEMVLLSTRTHVTTDVWKLTATVTSTLILEQFEIVGTSALLLIFVPLDWGLDSS